MATVLRNAFIYTANEGHECVPRGAIIIEGSTIAWIGPDAEAVVPSGATVIDLHGQVVIPGFINAHTHGGLSVYRGLCDDGDFEEWAAALAPYTGPLTDEDSRWGCYLAVMEMVKSGVTTACDCTRYGAGIFSEVASAVGMRSLSGALANSPSLRKTGRPNWPDVLGQTREAIEQRGSNGLCRFYLGAHSPYNCTPELIVEVKSEADRMGLPFNIHVAETRSEVETVMSRHGKRPLQHLYDLGVVDQNTIMAHCVWLDEREIHLVARAGAKVVHNPVSNAKLASGVAPVPSMLRAGIDVGLGTDSTLSNNAQSIFQEMKTAIMLQRASRLDGEALVARDVLRMAFLGGARALGWDGEIGSLEAGKRADLVALDLYHPLGLTAERVMSDIVYAAGPQNVRMVMVHGRVIYENGRFTLVDEAEIKERISRYYSAR